MTEKEAKKYIDYIIKYDVSGFIDNVISYKIININLNCVEFELVNYEDDVLSETTFFRLPIKALIKIYNEILIGQRKAKLKNINKIKKIGLIN